MRNRKYLVGALAATMAVGFSGIAYAGSATQTQTVDGTVSPTKVPAKKYAALKKFLTETTTKNTVPNGVNNTNQPAPSNRALIDFDDDFLFTIKGVPLNQVNKNNSLGQCSEAQITGQPAATAKTVCGKALIGEGSGQANLLGTPIDAQVTAFNGVLNGGKPVILLHSDPGFSPFVLTGTLVNSTAGKDYGKALDVNPIPPLAGGAAIQVFNADVGGTTYKRNGKKYNYVSGRCADKNKKWNFHGKFFFSGAPYSEPAFTKEATDTVNCKVQKPKKKKK